MSRQEARERLKETFIFERHQDKILLRDVALIEAVAGYEQDLRHAEHPHGLLNQARPASAPFSA